MDSILYTIIIFILKLWHIEEKMVLIFKFGARLLGDNSNVLDFKRVAATVNYYILFFFLIVKIMS